MSLFDRFKKAAETALDGGKDALIESQLNHRYGTLGKDAEPVRNLSIDRAGRSMKMALHLAGEAAPVEITIHRYELREIGGKQFLEIERLQTNRPWIDALFALKATSGKLLLPWELPPPAVMAIR